MRLYLIRHGETTWNRDKIFRGRYDVPLSDRGLAQAETLPSAFERIKLEALYASPLTRVQQTAAPLATAQGLGVESVDAVTDIDYGDWTTVAEADVKQRYASMFDQWQNAPAVVTFPNGESLSDVALRTADAVQRIAGEQTGAAAIASHRVPLKMVVLSLLGLGPADFWRVRLDTCSISAFEIDGDRTTLLKLNDTAHLGKMADESAADF